LTPAERPSDAEGEKLEPVAWFVQLKYGDHWSGDMLTDHLPSDDGSYRVLRPLYGPDAIASLTAQLREAERVAVKPREWRHRGDDLNASTTAGMFSVGRIGKGYTAIRRFIDRDGQDADQVLARDVSHEEALTAAERNYADCIRASLQPSPTKTGVGS
jgi:hypothetical protein